MQSSNTTSVGYIVKYIIFVLFKKYFCVKNIFNNHSFPATEMVLASDFTRNGSLIQCGDLKSLTSSQSKFTDGL